MSLMEGNLVVFHTDAERAAFNSQLEEQRRQNFNPAEEDYLFCGRKVPTANNGAEAFPDAFYALKEAALRGDLALVKTIYEKEWLSHTATGRFSNKDLFNIYNEALKAAHTPVAAFLLSQNVPFRRHHPETAVDKGMDSLL
jgi:hypothetical protein